MHKRWYPGFNPLSESFRKRFLWMLLPNFPIEFWSAKFLKLFPTQSGGLSILMSTRSARILSTHMGVGRNGS
jgi:hypothetical protein